jgi:hypothetical protein
VLHLPYQPSGPLDPDMLLQIIMKLLQYGGLIVAAMQSVESSCKQ